MTRLTTRTLTTLALAGLGATAMLAAPAAQAGPDEDYGTIRTDYVRSGLRIVNCRFGWGMLVSARPLAQANPEDGYNGFSEALDREIYLQIMRGCPKPKPAASSPAIPNGTRLILKSSPARATVGRKTRFTFTVTAKVRAKTVKVKGATVKFAGTTRKTDKNGRAVITKKFLAPSTRSATASMKSLKGASVKVRIVRPVRRRR
jgi:hypothetical protein